MDPITALVIFGIINLYKVLDKYYFKPDRIAGASLTIFNHTDFPTELDKWGRKPMSIFTKLRGGKTAKELWFDKSMYYASFNGEILDGFVDKKEDFNADSIFDLFVYLNYWHSGQVAKNIVFDKIINPMFNLGLKTVDNASTAHRFTAPDRRFYWTYDDYLTLVGIANAPSGQHKVMVFTDKRNVTHELDAKPYATALLSILQNFPFTSGYFIDGLNEPNLIISREKGVLARFESYVSNLNKTNLSFKNPVSKPVTTSKPNESNNNTSTDNTSGGDTKKASTFKVIAEKVVIGVIVGFIVILIFNLFKKKS